MLPALGHFACVSPRGARGGQSTVQLPACAPAERGCPRMGGRWLWHCLLVLHFYTCSLCVGCCLAVFLIRKIRMLTARCSTPRGGHFASLHLQPAQGLPPILVQKNRGRFANEISRRGGFDQHDPRVKAVRTLPSSNSKNRLKHARRIAYDAVIPLIRRNAVSFSVFKSTRMNILIATWCLLKTSPACVETSTPSPCRMLNAAWLESPTVVSPLGQFSFAFPTLNSD